MRVLSSMTMINIRAPQSFALVGEDDEDEEDDCGGSVEAAAAAFASGCLLFLAAGAESEPMCLVRISSTNSPNNLHFEFT